MPVSIDRIKESYQIAVEKYSALGIEVEDVLEKLDTIPLSIHCWQGDDLKGFENPDAKLTGGIQATGNYPGAARNPQELRKDMEKAFSLIPGKKRVNLHAIYLEKKGVEVERDEIKPAHFEGWVRWAKENDTGLDFNPTLFSHPKADDGLTLSHPDKDIRKFWINHVKQCRRISEYFGRELGTPSIMNIWIPDGYKDIPADRIGPRQRLKDSLDEALSEKIDKKHHKDAVESKVFGIGSESYVVGSHEFYLNYALQNDVLLCLDAGHFHPTETISDKISAISLFIREILLHVSRPVRWDSDHVVILDDELKSIAGEIVRGGLLDRVHIGLDFFDASINRVAAWVIGSRNMRKALLMALLEPGDELRRVENEFDFTTRLVMLEELKSYPWQAIWDYYCYSKGIPVGLEWLEQVREYEKTVLAHR